MHKKLRISVILALAITSLTLISFSLLRIDGKHDEDFNFRTKPNQTWDLLIYSSGEALVGAEQKVLGGFPTLTDCYMSAWRKTPVNGTFRCGYNCYNSASESTSSGKRVSQSLCNNYLCEEFNLE